ncbi:hypothetical protein TSUD_52990 [Trifolium subterraneum]|uniref:Uncharacterized protein n=1 Tax=Trifolium subterraneum TaxID=3900 RepID=A0A2Z6NIU5_TRISU|nr:hypothetical protein TSUD_52990 [Trifolium subterraneum]
MKKQSITKPPPQKEPLCGDKVLNNHYPLKFELSDARGGELNSHKWINGDAEKTLIAPRLL